MESSTFHICCNRARPARVVHGDEMLRRRISPAIMGRLMARRLFPGPKALGDGAPQEATGHRDGNGDGDH